MGTTGGGFHQSADREPDAGDAAAPVGERTATRRALIVGAAGVTAAGSAAALIGLNGSSSDTSDRADGAPPATSSTSAPAREIADPRVRAAHLLRRAGFGGTAAQIDEFAGLSREESADRLLNFETIDNSALDGRVAAASFNLTVPGRGVDNQRRLITFEMQRWWLTRMAYTARPLEERMTYIWHGLLTTQVSILEMMGAKTIVTQNELFRSHALSRYDDLLQAVAKDPAMMIYLNTADSTKEHPNENFPRELMELFSLGEGNYTEDDVRESARAFTGWRLSPVPRRPIPPDLTGRERTEFVVQFWSEWQPEWQFDPELHDDDVKTFLGRTGAFGGEDVISIILEQPAAARYITGRLFSEFGYRDPDEATIDALVEVWESSDHSVRDVVRAILTSDEFYSERAYRAQVRSPMDFAVSTVRSLQLETDWLGIERMASAMDQTLFEPPSVAGWPGGATWLSSSTFFARVNFLDSILFPGGEPAEVPALSGDASASELVDDALALLVDGDISDASRTAIHDHARSITDPRERAATVAYLVLASPEYQLA